MIKRRRQYTGMPEATNNQQFRWMEELSPRIENILKQDTMSVDEFRIIISFMAGCIQRVDHRPQTITYFRTVEYEQGYQSNIFYISDIKSLQMSQTAFILSAELERSVFNFKISMISMMSKHGPFLHKY